MIVTTSGVTIEGKPFCTLAWGKETGQMSPDEMRQLARTFMEVAEAAESDAAMLLLLRHDVGISTEKIAGLLKLMRDRRDQARQLSGDQSES
jgi:hypothetical protein